MGHKAILLERNLDEVIDQRLKDKLRDIWNDESLVQHEHCLG